MKILKTLILSGLLLSAPASADVLADKNCGSCHRLKAEEIEKSFTGPDLHYSGNKFKPEWLKQFLINPEVIRPAGFVTDSGFLPKTDLPPHASSSIEDANALTKELMTLKISTPVPVNSEPLSKGLRAKIKYQFVVHAEMNCIYNAGYNGTQLDGSTMYVYGLPVCNECAKGIIQVGIRRVVIPNEWEAKDVPDRWKISVLDTQRMFKEAGVIYDFI